jgi:hypothetical protein
MKMIASIKIIFLWEPKEELSDFYHSQIVNFNFSSQTIVVIVSVITKNLFMNGEMFINFLK